MLEAISSLDSTLFRLSLKVETWFLLFRQWTGWFKGTLCYAIVDNYEEANKLFERREVDVVVVQHKDGKGALLIGRAKYTTVYRLMVGIMPMYPDALYTRHEFNKASYAVEDLIRFTRHYNLYQVKH